MRRPFVLAVFLSAIFTTSCGDFFGEGTVPPGVNPPPKEGPTTGITEPGTSKPTISQKTIPQLRDPTVDGYEAPCSAVQGCSKYRIEKLVVTSETFVVDRDKTTKKPYLFGFFVADPAAVDADGRLKPYSGLQIAVVPGAKAFRGQGYTFGRQDNAFPDPWKVNYEGFPRPGDVITVEGESKHYFGMPQLGKIALIEKLAVSSDVKSPLPARFDGDTAGKLKGGHPAATINGVSIAEVKPHQDAASWAGVLVELANVKTAQACVPTPYPFKEPTQLRDYGYLQVSGDVEIGTLFGSTLGGFWKSVRDATQQTCENVANKCEDSRQADQHFDSIVGIVDYSYGVYRVNPRSKNDVQPQSVFVASGAGSCR